MAFVRTSVVVLVLAATASGAAHAVPQFVLKWGAMGTANGQFDDPRDLVVGPTGEVFVLDDINSRVQVFDASGTYLRQWSVTFPTGGIGIGNDGSIFVAVNEGWSKYDPSGTLLASVSVSPFLAGSPEDVAVDSNGNVYVATQGFGSTYEISKLTADGSTELAGISGANGSGNGVFNTIERLAFDASDQLYVSDARNFRIQVLNTNLQYLRKWSVPAPLGDPSGIAVDALGDVHVTDSFQNRLLKFSNTGTLIHNIGISGANDGQFNKPFGVAVFQNRIYVADSFNHRVQRFDEVPADLQLAKDDGVASAIAGTTVTYTLTVTNNGPGASASATVTDVLPSGLTFSSSSDCSAAAGTVTCAIGALASGASKAVSFVAQISAGQVATMTNSALVVGSSTDLTPGNNTASHMTPIVRQTDLGLAKDDSVTSVAAGSNVTYTLTVTNGGPSNSSGSTVTDVLPPGLSFSSSSGCSSAAGTVTCTIGALAAGANRVVSFVATVDPSQTAAITNTASVAAAQSDPNASNNGASHDTPIDVETDLSLAKDDGVTSAAAGSDVTYTLTITNEGPSDSSGSTVTDVLPPGLTFSSSSECSEAAGTVTCAIGPLAAGAAQAATFVAAIDSGQVADVTNSASVAAHETDPEAGNDTAMHTTPIALEVELTISKDDGVSTALPGETLTYTIEVANAGPSNEPEARIADDFPAMLSCHWTSVASGGATGNTSGSGALGEMLSLPAGSSVTYTAECDVSEAFAGEVVNTATATASVSGVQVLAQDTTSILSPSMINGEKSFFGMPMPGQPVSYLIILTNTSATSQLDNPGDELIDILPDQLELIGATANAGVVTANPATRTVTWNGVIPGGGTIEITIDAVVSASADFSVDLVNQAVYHFDPNGDGVSESAGVTDDPRTPEPGDATSVRIVREEGIPTVSELGLVVLTALLSIGGVALSRRARHHER